MVSQTLIDPVTSSIIKKVLYEYDAVGKIQSETVERQGRIFTKDFLYDEKGNIVRISNRKQVIGQIKGEVK